jgi:hypothetical protein
MRSMAARWRTGVVAGLLAALLAGCGSSDQSPAPSPLATPSPSPIASVISSVFPSLDPSPSPSPSTYPSGYVPLDGLAAPASLATRLPVAVMIDDNIVARPQSGFSKASVVYQAPADGGEDRYMLVFQEQDAADIGPVRSGRPYFVNWAAEYRAAFAHYGGDRKTLAYIPTIAGTLLYDLDDLKGSASAFHRIKTRAVPHNAYTNTAALYKTAGAHGYPASMVDGLASRPFADDLSASERPSGGSIRIPYNTGVTSYTYDPAANQYLRFVAGKPQTDALDGSRVTARNVVVLYMGLSVDPESEPGHHRPVLAQIGSGKAIVFRDGKAFPGTWRKRDAGDLTRFYDSSGNEISLVRGRIFIQVVPTGTNVTYSLS